MIGDLVILFQKCLRNRAINSALLLLDKKAGTAGEEGLLGLGKKH